MKNELVVKLAKRGNLDDDLKVSSDIDEKFFIEYDNEYFADCEFHVEVATYKSDSISYLEVEINGGLNIPCDRCCEPLYLAINLTETYHVIIEDEYDKIEEEENDTSVVLIKKDDKELDLKDIIYDMIFLSIPMQNIHSDDENGNSTCNASQLEILERYKKTDHIDPRWEGLKNIKLN